jgi:hypothetical protein
LQKLVGVVVTLAILLAVQRIEGQGKESKNPPKKKGASASFKNDVFPVIQKHCLPCHAEDNFNPSELSLDSYDKMKEGGKHGTPWVEGKSKESIVIQKLSENPPFGDRMPLNSKKKISEGNAKWLSVEELKTIADWIDQGAKNN